MIGYLSNSWASCITSYYAYALSLYVGGGSCNWSQ